MTELLLTMLTALFSGFDFQTTSRRMRRFGPGAELNPATRWLVQKLGVKLGIGLSIGVPFLFWTILFLVKGWVVPFAFYAGMKGQLVVAQLLSRKLEESIAENMGLSSSDEDTNPPGGSQ